MLLIHVIWCKSIEVFVGLLFNRSQFGKTSAIVQKAYSLRCFFGRGIFPIAIGVTSVTDTTLIPAIVNPLIADYKNKSKFFSKYFPLLVSIKVASNEVIKVQYHLKSFNGSTRSFHLMFKNTILTSSTIKEL